MSQSAVMSSPPGQPVADTAPQRQTIIEPKKGWVAVDWRELWEFRELLGVMLVRDLKTRYKQTILGAFWAVLSPLMNMAMITIVFGYIVQVNTGDVPKALFFFANTVPWALFTSALNGSANSLQGNIGLIRKIYFPRLYIPLATISTAVVDFLIAFVLLMIAALCMGYLPGVQILMIVPLVLLTLVTALGAGLWLGAMMAVFRDIRTMIPFGVQAWMYASLVAFPRDSIPERFRWYFDINPLVPVIEGFRWALLGTPTSPQPLALAGVAVAGLLLFSGLYVFRRMEKTFVDVA